MVLIIGAGPAGLFAAHYLASFGVKCRILEMGKPLSERSCPQTPECNCKRCDILEGIGGAGGFSDGKNTYSLSRGTQMEEIFDKDCETLLTYIDHKMLEYSTTYNRFVHQIKDVPNFIDRSIFQFASYPLRHMGTDGIQEFIENLTGDLVTNGTEILTGKEVISIRKVEDLWQVTTGSSEVFQAENVIVATGLQGSPWLESAMSSLEIEMNHGPAGFGVRFETDADNLSRLFDIFYDFKLNYRYAGILYRSFCCNQSGFVLNENHRTMGIKNVNGHSYLGLPRSGRSNFAIIAKIEGADPQNYVKDTAREINQGGQGTVVQRVTDFMTGFPSDEGAISTGTNPQAHSGVDIGQFLPERLLQGFRAFIAGLADLCPPNIISERSLIYAPEIKYYGMKLPVDFSTCLLAPGLYVAGNATGYLDSFVSAALTGIKAAQNILQTTKKKGR